jgi:TPR repeat protein
MQPFSRCSIFRRLLCFASAALVVTSIATTPAVAAKRSDRDIDAKRSDSVGETRRAFVVGVAKYSDPNIQPLGLPLQDADGIAASLRQVGFDEKNVKVYKDPGSKDAFSTEFKKFLDTVKEGDDVFFYFSGHGYGGTGPDGQSLNYLLFGDVKSPIEFAHSKASDSERKQQAAVAALAAKFLPDYESVEIPTRGISEKDIISRIQERKPRVAIIVLDACRTLLSSTAKGELNIRSIRGTSDGIPENFMVMYSAKQGQDAIERFSSEDRPDNSLFTTYFRKFIVTPDQDLEHLAMRVKEAVTQAALDKGLTQEPVYINEIRAGDFSFVGSIGSARFELNVNPCDYAEAHWGEIKRNPSVDQLEFHLKQFPNCPTKRDVQQALEDLKHGATIVTSEGDENSIDPCDRWAASEEDRDRPSGVPGVNFGKLDADKAIDACGRSANNNSAVVRYLFNLARGYNRKAQDMADDNPNKKRIQVDAYLRYKDAADRGYLAAFVDLALMYEKGEGVSKPDPAEAVRLLELAAKQGYPLAMYHLATRYHDGQDGLARNVPLAYELYIKAAEAGNISAMVEAGWHLATRPQPDPLRAVEWLSKAATTPNAGSDGAKAKRLLGILSLFDLSSAKGEAGGLPKDPAQALLWLAQAAEENDTWAQLWLAILLESGNGLTTQQPQLAERYWRLAAYSGNVEAKVGFAERILSNRVLLKPENGPGEVVKLLEQAVDLGSSRAALRLAKIYRTGEFHHDVRPEEAIKYAYKAISLAEAQVAGTSTLQGSRDDNPLDEIAAGILLAEMAANGEAIDQDGKPLLTQEERDRLELYYGRPDPETKKVKVRSLKVLMTCGIHYFWIWDWGRDESPTEMQFRYYYEAKNHCVPYVEKTRETLKNLWDIVRKDKDKKFAFADLLATQSDAAESTGK